MGYHTYYRLEVDCSSNTGNLIIADLRESNDDAYYAISEEGHPTDPAKWYDAEVDLLAFSKKYPDVLFTLSGEGDDPDDLWVKYFKNGKVQTSYAKITYEPFDPAKLE